jgi:glycosyltransferase involved in cell wall biosynthesis
MHIAFVTPEYPLLRSGGIGTSIRNLARALARRGHRVSVVGWGTAGAFDDGGVRIRFLSRPHLPKTGWLVSGLCLQRELRRMVRDEGLDVIEAPDWCGISAGLRPGCPVVVRCNGSAVYFADLMRERVRPSVRLTEWLALKQADSITAVSLFTASRTASLFRLTAVPQVIPNGVDLGEHRPGDAGSGDRGLVLFVGTLVRKKGIIDLCRAFSAVAARRTDARLLIVGRDTPDRATHSASMWEVCRAQLSPEAAARTEYLGEKPAAAIARYRRRASIVALPSYAEALPLAWLETMAASRPLVGYDTPWARELVSDRESGLLVRPGDVDGLAAAILELLDDAALRLRLGTAARRVVEAGFSSQRVADLSVAWYESVTAHRPAGPVSP